MSRKPATKKAFTDLPEPVLHEGRICFGIAFFKTEADADRYADFVTDRGDTYNGGYFHGMACGRDAIFDHKHPVLGQLFAVTTR